MLNTEKTALTQGQQAPNDKALMLPQEKKMALCEICGSFLVANDAAERTQSHVTGKQHIGYGMVRDFISEFKVNSNSSFRLCLGLFLWSYNIHFYLTGSQGESKRRGETSKGEGS